MKKILVYGYGNPGRQDDVLGIRLADKMKEWAKKNKFKNIITDINYQLNIEDSYNLYTFDLVVFADASTTDIPDYSYEPVNTSIYPGITTHSVSPGFIVGLCNKIYQKTPESHILHIKGYEWEFMSEPTKKAEENLQKAFKFLTSHLKSYLSSY